MADVPAGVDEPDVRDVFAEDPREGVPGDHAVLPRGLVGEAQRVDRTEEREAALLHDDRAAGGRVVVDGGGEVGDVEPPDLVEKRPLLARGGERGGVARVLEAVLGVHRDEGVDVQKREERNQHDHEREQNRYLTPPHAIHLPWLYM